MRRFMVIDSHSLIHRAFHALPKLTTRKGELVNAVYGFLLVFLKAVKDFQPEYIAACFDLPEPTFRHKEFEDYKATRPKTPEDLGSQIPKVREVLSAFSVPIFEKQGFEADDLIGTIAQRVAANSSKLGPVPNYLGQAPEIETIIVTGDLDLLQVVDENTKVYALKRGIKDTVLYDESKVWERYGFSPTLLPDFKALKGDVSDNIPGVPGIGEKTASALLKEFGSLENLYSALDQRPLPKAVLISVNQRVRAKLEQYKEQAFFSKMLASLRYDAPIDFDLAKCSRKNYNKEKAVRILKEFEFQSLMERLSEIDKSNPIKRLF